MNRIADRATAGEGIIQRGAGKGLRFDATHCNPGYLTGTSSPDEQQVLVDVLNPGNVFYDLGANAGFYAVIAARHVGPEGHVYAFEPTPELANRIRYNSDLNGFSNLSVIEAAVCDKDGSIQFGSEGFDIENSIKRAKDNNTIKVPSTTLDSWAKEKRPPDVIMMDIEGAELEALHGAMNLIQSHLPIMLIEVHWLGNDFVDFFEDRLRPLGYKITTYSGDPIPTSGSDRYHALLTPTMNE